MTPPTTVTGSEAPTLPPQPRISLLALPSPTRIRSLLLVTAVLTAGLFAGTWLHNTTPVGDRWVRAVVACQAKTGAPAVLVGLQEAIGQQRDFQACTRPVELVRAAWSIGGVIVAGLGGVAVMYVVPVVVRRRRRLRPAGPRLAPAEARLAHLAREEELSRPPRLMVGHATQRDAFSFGTPGRYFVALPKKVVVGWRRPEETFDPVVRHELAHIAGHDVPVAWLSRSLVYVLAPLLGAPVVVAVVSAEYGLAADIGIRALLLAGVALLVAQAILRSREFDADLRAARQPSGPASLLALFPSVRPVPAARNPWLRAWANHPDPGQRTTILVHPERSTQVTFVDGLAAAFLAALSAPLIVSVLITVLAPFGLTPLAITLAYLAVGPLLGSAIGLALWRRALVARVSSLRTPVLPLGLGAAAGLILGAFASLGEAGLGEAGLGVLQSLQHWQWLLTSVALGLGATLLTAALADVWADAAPRFRRPRAAWAIAILISSVLFTLVLWMAEILRESFEFGGWALTSGTVMTSIGGWAPGAIAVLLALAVVLALAVGRPGFTSAPAWLTEPPHQLGWRPRTGRLGRTTALVALVGGLLGAIFIMATAVLRGTAEGAAAEHRLYGYVWAAAAAGVAATLTLCLLVPRRGAALALVAGPMASLLAALGFLAVIFARNGRLPPFAVGLALRSLGIGLALTVLAAGFALVGEHASPTIPLGRTLTLAGALAVALTVVAVAAQPQLTRWLDQTFSDYLTAGTEASQGDLEVLDYATTVAPRVQARMRSAVLEAQQLSTDPSLDPAERAQRIENGPAAEFRRLSAELQALSVRDGRLKAPHEQLLTSLDHQLRALHDYSEYLRTGDTNAAARSREEEQQAADRYAGWRSTLDQLVSQLGGD